jgi:hypothetical protein
MGTALRWLYLWLVIPGLLFGPRQVDADVSITTNAASVSFPQFIKFRLDAGSPVGIQKVTLVYGTDRLSCESSTARMALDFDPGKQVSLEWKLEFARSGAIPPGVDIWWQWEITDALGKVVQTEKKSLDVQDKRFDWRSLTQNGITVQWYQGSQSFGQAIMQNALRDIKSLSSQMNIKPTHKIQIIVYASTQAMRQALVISDSWAGAVALPDYSTIFLGLAPDELGYADYYIPHELTHLVVGELTFNCMGVNLPTWLNEGLAEIVQEKPSQAALDAVILAIESHTLPALDYIASGFSADGDLARLEYTQSYLAVDYLLKTYEPEKMSSLLAAFQSGLLTNEALLKVYGMDTTGVDAAWRKSLGFNGVVPSPEKKPTCTLVPTMALWTAAVRPTETASPVPTRTAVPSTIPVSPTSAVSNVIAAPAGDPPDRSLVPFCLGILVMPVVLVLFMIRKKESVK